MRKLVLAISGIVLATSVVTTHADTIDFGQFGPEYTHLPNSFTGVTNSGASFKITGTGLGFVRCDQGSCWGAGTIGRQFPTGTKLLYDNGGWIPGGPGAVTIDFLTPISSLTGIAAEANSRGDYTAIAAFYDGVSLLGASSYNSLSSYNPGSLRPTFSFSAPSITSVVFTVTNDGLGFALGGGLATPPPVPEPSTWALMLAGLAGLGFAGYRRNKAATSAA